MSSDPLPAGVSREAFGAVVRAYADRVYDDVRRTGATSPEAVEVVEASALRLLERLRTHPEGIGDLVGAWFWEARLLAERLVDGDDARQAEPHVVPGEPVAILHSSPDDAAARRALAELTERDRLALLLKDAYDLPISATAVALGVDAAAAARLVPRARLRFLELVTDDSPSQPSGHDAELAALGQLVDGSLDPARIRSVRAHASACRVCRSVQAAQVEARTMLTGLAIVALADTDRDAVIARTTAAAAKRLPTSEQLAARAAGGGFGIELRPALVVGCLLTALLLGAGIAIVTTGDERGTTAGAPNVEQPTTPAPDSPSVTPSSATPTPSATGTPTSTASATATSTGGPSSAPPSTPPPSGPAAITLSRTSGPNCTPIQVYGRNFRPGQLVRVYYLDLLGNRTGSSSSAEPNAEGRFTARLMTCDPNALPGPHTVRATSGSRQADATYTAT